LAILVLVGSTSLGTHRTAPRRPGPRPRLSPRAAIRGQTWRLSCGVVVNHEERLELRILHGGPPLVALRAVAICPYIRARTFSGKVHRTGRRRKAAI